MPQSAAPPVNVATLAKAFSSSEPAMAAPESTPHVVMRATVGDDGPVNVSLKSAAAGVLTCSTPRQAYFVFAATANRRWLSSCSVVFAVSVSSAVLFTVVHGLTFLYATF